MATIAIGDIHGNSAALRDLLGKMGPALDPGDTVVFLGDYLDRGPDVKGCIDSILAFRRASAATVVALLGNHEQWFLRTLRDPTRHSWITGMEAFDTIRSYSVAAAEELRCAIRRAGMRLFTERIRLPYEALFGAMPAEHLDFLDGLARWHRTSEAVFVHGGTELSGADPAVQGEDTLVWGPDGFPDGYRGQELVVYGHRSDVVLDDSAWPAPRLLERTIGIDSIAEGVLTAIRLPDRMILQSDRHRIT